MERFVRCRHCNLPHVASVLRCPFTGKAVDPQTRLPDEGAWVPSRDALTGTLLDERYLVGANIGDGAMGTVYRAEHVNLGTEVAVKVLHSRFEAGSAAEKRFLREGHSAGRIDHPNVVRIFDVGRLPDGAPYLVMELLEGEELSASIPEGGLPPARVADLADQLLRGLEQAHAQRVVHRDIKPDNVFLALEGGVEVLKILDFSIAKDQAAEAMTRDGEVLGTPHYLAPEQAAGKPVDARVDLWASGVVLYELLTGEPPFGGDNFPQLVMAILMHSADPPSQRVRALAPEVDAFFERALAKDPDERFQTAGSMRTALLHALAACGPDTATAGGAGQDVAPAFARTQADDLHDTLID